MISQNKKKLIVALAQKKKRDETSLFLAEGRKTVHDLIVGGLTCEYLAGTRECLEQMSVAAKEVVETTAEDIATISTLQTRTEVIAILRKPDTEGLSEKRPDDLILALDEIQDPGNMGTIVRTADWFGIRTIVCSRTCADVYGMKAVAATKGALCRVGVTYCELEEWLSRVHDEWRLPIIGTFLDGENFYKAEIKTPAVVLMGNEGRGISDALARYVSQRILIPPFPASATTSESLNVGAATAVVVSEIRRRAAL